MGLLKRGDTYYYRKRIPAELRHFFAGRQEIWRSLGTNDPSHAAELCIMMEKTYQITIERLRQPGNQLQTPLAVVGFVLEEAEECETDECQNGKADGCGRCVHGIRSRKLTECRERERACQS